jgi:hypothetical protein
MLKTQFRIREVSLSAGSASPTIPAHDAALAVIADDSAASRIHAPENVIIQIPSPRIVPAGALATTSPARSTVARFWRTACGTLVRGLEHG